MNRHGFSLIELIVVIGLIAIALSIAIPQYNLIQRRSQIARQAREISADINSFRLSAMYSKQRRAIILNPRNMQFRRYANDTDDLIAAGVTMFAKNLDFEIRNRTNLAVPLNNNFIVFDSRGTANNFTIVILPVDLNSGADNCIVVTELRTNIGRMTNANTCTAL